ncbi:MAG: hypothetical protein R3E10_18540 [Gemmatimonadota bacterium]
MPSQPTAVEFVGETGPGAVINQYLPQPGQYTGRRIIQITDTPKTWWKTEASQAGVPWADVLGLESKTPGLWEVVKPERLTDVWFTRRLRVPRGGSRRGLSLVQTRVNLDAQEVLQQQGSLRNWGRGSTAARMFEVDDDTGSTTPDQSGPDITPPSGSGGGGHDSGAGGGGDDGLVPDFVNSISSMDEGVVHLPSSTWGGGVTTVPVDVEEPPQPMLFLIQVLGISSYLGDYGLGRTVKTFTLLPGETATISTRTWRATEETVAAASSIIDSYTDSASDRFAETVMTETTDSATQEKTENWHAEAEVKGSFGFGSASVSGGGGGEYSSSTEEFAKAVDEAVSEHAAESSSHRENTVTSNSERSASTEDEEVVERTISNINVGRVLNFTFRELNQVYLTKTHLKEVRVAFSNGQSGSWREEPISSLRKLVAEVIKPAHVDEVCQDLVRAISVVFDLHGDPVHVLERVELDGCGGRTQVRVAVPDADCAYKAPTADGTLYYRFRRGPLGQAPEEEHPVDGVLLKERSVVMATDSVVVEALLGQSDALDGYSKDLQDEAIREKQLANEREALAQRIVADRDVDAAALYAQLFVVNDVEAGTA